MILTVVRVIVISQDFMAFCGGINVINCLMMFEGVRSTTRICFPYGVVSVDNGVHIFKLQYVKWIYNYRRLYFSLLVYKVYMYITII